MESRSLASEFTTDGKTLSGYAAVFNSPTRIRSDTGRVFNEIVRPGAFRNALASGGDIVSFFNHDQNKLLGRTSSGTLKLEEDAHGLRFTVHLPDYASDVREMVARGDLRGASFSFGVRKGGEKWDGNTRELTDLYLAECGPVVSPAYGSTSGTLGLRSADLDADQGDDGQDEIRRRKLQLKNARYGIVPHDPGAK